MYNKYESQIFLETSLPHKNFIFKMLFLRFEDIVMNVFIIIKLLYKIKYHITKHTFPYKTEVT